MGTSIIKNVRIVNEGSITLGDVLIENKIIAKVAAPNSGLSADVTIDGTGKHLFPGCIDDQVHFREPGLTHKGEIYTEAKAAVAGGVTTYMEMPNTVPNVFTQQLLEDKYKRASEVSLANYSFFMGASNDNLEEVLKTDARNVCGIKVFMGSSTGNMLVDKRETLEGLFSKCKMLIAVHCEDEATIKHNMQVFKDKYGEDVPVECHPLIRSEEACYKSSSLAVELAKKYNTRLHVLHISTAKEVELFDNKTPLKEKRITAEACIHHLWFSDEDYKTKGNFIKWNPAVKKASDRDAILKGLLDNKIDIIATDHAPHTLEEKAQSYFKAPSGGPLVQHSLVAMLELHKQGKISLEKIAEKMAHAPADCFQIEKRGYIREGYFADIVLVDLNSPWVVEKSTTYYKCGWSPFDGLTFHSKVTHTFVNGHLVYTNSTFDERIKGERLSFDRK
ncbi:MAG TPA: dihydroorotase [Bacteroidia bacterium]|jgi:dihydroorotase